MIRAYGAGSVDWLCILLFIVRPHSYYFYGARFLEYLVNKAVVYIDSPRVRAVQITDEFLKWRRILKRVCP